MFNRFRCWLTGMRQQKTEIRSDQGEDHGKILVFSELADLVVCSGETNSVQLS
jgi:hypothetical protein